MQSLARDLPLCGQRFQELQELESLRRWKVAVSPGDDGCIALMQFDRLLKRRRPAVVQVRSGVADAPQRRRAPLATPGVTSLNGRLNSIRYDVATISTQRRRTIACA